MTPPPSFPASRLTDTDPAFAQQTVLGLSVCGREDGQPEERRRVMVSPGNEPRVYFPMSRDVAPNATFLNLNDATWRQILTVTGGFAYDRTQTIGDRTIPLGPGFAHLCRGDAGADGRYPVFITNNTIVNNAPGNPAPLRRLNFEFRFDEIRAIVNSGILPADHYRVAPDNHRYLDLMPDETEINRIIQLIQATNSPIAADRRAPMLEAIRQFQRDLPHQGMDMQERMRTEMRWQMIGMGLLSVYTVLLGLGKAGPINTAVAFLPRLLGTPLVEGAVNLFNRATGRSVNWRWTNEFFREMRDNVRYRGLSTVASTGTNLSAAAQDGEIRPAADATTPAMAELLERRLRTTRGSGSAVFEAPPGWGKEVLMRNLALRNPDVLIIQISSDNLQAGTKYRGTLEERLDNIPKEIESAHKKGQVVWLMIDEFHESALAGRSEHDSRTLLERWKGPLARGTLRIAGFSTPVEMLKLRYIAGMFDEQGSRNGLEPWQQEALTRFEADPRIVKIVEIRPLLERFLPIQAAPRTQADIVSMLEDEIQNRRNQGELIEMDRPTAELIARMALSDVEREGYIPRRAIDNIMSGVITQLSETTEPNQPIRITTEVVRAFIVKTYPSYARRFGITATGALPAANPAPAAANNAPANAAVAAPNPMLEVLTRGVNDTALEAALRNADPALADFYRTNLSNAASPVTTVGELARRIGAIDPAILAQSNQALAAEGLSIAQAPERFLFEALTRAAAARGGWTPSNPTELPARLATFETELRRDNALERRAADPDVARREQEERERREAEARRTGGGRP